MIRWALIAGRIPGRTDNEIKNYWNTHLSKKLISQGIDPRTHKPLINLINHGSSLQDNQLDPVPEYYSNPKPPNNFISSELGDKTTEHVTQDVTPPTNLEYHYYQNQLQVVADNSSMENWRNSDQGLVMGQPSSDGNGGGDYNVENCNEDMISLFLDSLMNDNFFPNQQQQQPNKNVVAADHDQNFIHGNTTTWEAGMMMSSMVAFGNDQNSSNNHQQYHP